MNLAAGVLLFAAAFDVEASSWVSIGPTAPVLSLAFDAGSPGVLYAGTDGMALYRRDEAGGWQRVMRLPEYPRLGTIAVAPSNPRGIYVAVNSGVRGEFLPPRGGIYRSLDGGTNWEFLQLHGDDLVFKIVVDPKTPGVLYSVAGACFCSFRGCLPLSGGVACSGQVYRSTNGGTSWAPAGRGLEDKLVTDLVIDQHRTSVLYASTLGTRSLFKSVDGGLSWNLQPDLSNGVPSTCGVGSPLAASSSDPTVLYAGGVGPNCPLVLESVDGGLTWTAAGPVGGYYVRSLLVDPANPRIVYASATPAGLPGEEEGGVFQTLDSGQTWVALDQGAPSHSVGALVLDSTGSKLAAAFAGGAGVFEYDLSIRRIFLPPSRPPHRLPRALPGR